MFGMHVLLFYHDSRCKQRQGKLGLPI